MSHFSIENSFASALEFKYEPILESVITSSPTSVDARYPSINLSIVQSSYYSTSQYSKAFINLIVHKSLSVEDFVLFNNQTSMNNLMCCEDVMSSHYFAMIFNKTNRERDDNTRSIDVLVDNMNYLDTKLNFIIRLITQLQKLICINIATIKMKHQNKINASVLKESKIDEDITIYLSALNDMRKGLISIYVQRYHLVMQYYHHHPTPSGIINSTDYENQLNQHLTKDLMNRCKVVIQSQDDFITSLPGNHLPQCFGVWGSYLAAEYSYGDIDTVYKVCQSFTHHKYRFYGFYIRSAINC